MLTAATRLSFLFERGVSSSLKFMPYIVLVKQSTRTLTLGGYGCQGLKIYRDQVRRTDQTSISSEFFVFWTMEQANGPYHM